MKIIISMIRLLILTCITLSSMVLAQDPAATASEDKEKKGRRAWLIATSLPEGVKSPVNVLAGGEVSLVRISKRSVGTAIKVPKDGLIQVVNPIVSEDGKTTYEILASLTVPEGVNESLGILVPVPDLTPPLKFRSKVVDLDKFRGGGALFVNITSVEIGVVLGSEKKTIKPGQIQIINLGEFTGAKSLTVSYHYRMPNEEKWNLISASTAPFYPAMREILIFSYNAEMKQVDYHGMSFPVIEQ